MCFAPVPTQPPLISLCSILYKQRDKQARVPFLLLLCREEMVRYTTRGGKTNNRCNICIQNHPCTYALLHGPQVKLHITHIISSFSVMQTSQIVVTTQRGRLISRLIFLFLPACPTTGNVFKTRPSSDKPALSCYVECATHFGVMRYVLKGT